MERNTPSADGLWDSDARGEGELIVDRLLSVLVDVEKQRDGLKAEVNKLAAALDAAIEDRKRLENRLMPEVGGGTCGKS